MFYQESATIAEQHNHFLFEIEKVDTYLASLSNVDGQHLRADYLSHRLNITKRNLAQIFELYVEQALLTRSECYYCEDCEQYLQPIERLEIISCDICGKQISNLEPHTEFRNNKPYWQPSIFSIYQPDQHKLLELYKDFKDSEKSASTKVKGETLEALSSYILECFDGFMLKAKDFDTTYGEIDIVFSNRNTSHDFFRVSNIGSMFVVECKNWKEPAGVEQVGHFDNKMRFSQSKFGLYFSKSGFTSLDNRAIENSKRYLTQALSEGRCVIPISGKDIDAVSQGEDFAEMIIRKQEDMRLW